MNHYPRHIGDWITATAHLSEVEECIYSRMLDQYYARERALPSDPAAVCRLVRATSKEAKKAVSAILSEFFTAHEDGYHQGRCDAEIEAYREGAEERDQKAAHETERMRRHRERRKALFDALRERGIVPKWDTPLRDLQRLCNANSIKPETHLQREQVMTCNASATAIQNHNQNQNQKSNATTESPTRTDGQAAPPKPESKPENPPTKAGLWSAELNRRGVRVTPMHPTLLQWIDDGFTLLQLLDAVQDARQKKPAPEPLPANYLDPILRNPPKRAQPVWWASEAGIEGKGRELGMTPRPGEGWPQFKDRINAKLSEQRAA